MRVKTPNVRRRTAQRYSQVVMTSTALSRCRWQYRQRMAGLTCLTLSRLEAEAEVETVAAAAVDGEDGGGGGVSDIDDPGEMVCGLRVGTGERIPGGTSGGSRGSLATSARW